MCDCWQTRSADVAKVSAPLSSRESWPLEVSVRFSFFCDLTRLQPTGGDHSTSAQAFCCRETATQTAETSVLKGDMVPVIKRIDRC